MRHNGANLAGTTDCPCLCHYGPVFYEGLTPNVHPEHCSECYAEESTKVHIDIDRKLEEIAREQSIELCRGYGITVSENTEPIEEGSIADCMSRVAHRASQVTAMYCVEIILSIARKKWNIDSCICPFCENLRGIRAAIVRECGLGGK